MTWAELRDSAHALCRAFDPAVMSVADVAALLPTLTSLRRMLAATEAQAAARVAESDRWRSSGARTPADHLARQLGTSVGEANRLLETGKRLGSSRRCARPPSTVGSPRSSCTRSPPPPKPSARGMRRWRRRPRSS